MSRRIAEYSVACGVFPPGLSHNSCSTIAVIISWAFIGSAAPAKTCNAALTQESFFSLAGWAEVSVFGFFFNTRGGASAAGGAEHAGPCSRPAVLIRTFLFVAKFVASQPPEEFSESIRTVTRLLVTGCSMPAARRSWSLLTTITWSPTRHVFLT